MKTFLYSCILFFMPLSVLAQEEDTLRNEFRFSGQLSGWTGFNPDTDTKVWLGARYIPQLNYALNFRKERKLDFEGSANIFGDIGFAAIDDISADGNIKPYRLWARYSTAQSELRVGLQKLNFGSAQIFRPLMWFDTMDPRDPLQMTDGVWGVLFRYYFLNNANIWIWGLGGNSDRRGFDQYGTWGKIAPEAGGRVQLPFKSAEAGLSYNFREADIAPLATGMVKAPEHKAGFDVRADVTVGLWLEASWTHYARDMGEVTNQQMATLGIDYTFGIGNGLGVTAEHMLYVHGQKAFRADRSVNFSGVSLSYPLTLFDNISAVVYYDWANRNVYSFVNWHRQLNALSFYVMAFWNPKTGAMPGQSDFGMFSGKGLQVMLVWNH